ncbi:(3S,6E)-nerolidol synthase 1-like [Humulus lupulus]|uniref:(3S,6E)-nerolidol synthase 1-like n=1 Tax=Humulus lupulus TaxID=3486 RepID=UPI002B409DC3|nr:(3S,6E)-nerolidol synthase 1-like [Humulus lupulus]
MALSSYASFCSFIFIPSVSHHKTTNSENSKLIRNSYYDDPTPQRWSNINTHNHNTLLSSTHPLQNFKPLPKYPCTNIDHDLEIYRELIRKAGEDRPFEGLKIVDAIQRLGIDYIFEEEIDVILQKQYKFLNDHHHQDLHEVALRFRLLRQHGHFIPADVFNKFKDSKGMFDKMLSEDINGLISLYEASHLSIDGEHILDEAALFTTQHLINTSMMRRSLNHYQTTFVANTLKNPTHKTLSKFTAKNLFGVHPSMNEYINLFKELAKSEFNKVQFLHRGEIDQVTKWSRKIGLGKELEFARIQPLKWYIWSLGCLTDPILSQQRVELTKAVSFIYIIDDIFDVYGSLDELILFTQAVSSWENSDIEKLPEYMKICFEALDNMINESCHVVYQKHGWSPLHSLRKTWGRLCHSFLVEAKWFASGHVANTEEYLKNGVVSSGIPALLLHIFLLLGQGLTSKNALDFVENMPPIVTSTASVVRLWNDLGNAQDKNPKGDDGSYVECYMKEREGSSIEDACENIIEKTSYAWKCLNKECIMNPNPVIPPTFQKACLNFARVVPLRYTYNDDNQQNLEELVKSILYESL